MLLLEHFYDAELLTGKDVRNCDYSLQENGLTTLVDLSVLRPEALMAPMPVVPLFVMNLATV